MKCNKDCLNCKLSACIHDLEDVEEYINDKKRQKNKTYKAQYYLLHKAEIDAKQKEYDRYHRNSESCHAYYMRHKEKINRKHRERYANNREARLQKAKEYYWEHREEISERRKKRRLESLTIRNMEVEC